MPKTPRPSDPRGLKAWAQANWANDPTRQQREMEAGLKAIEGSKASAERNKAEAARRAANVSKARRGY